MTDIGDGMYQLVVTGKSLTGSSSAYEYKITDGNNNWYGWDNTNAYFTPHITGTYTVTYLFDSNTNNVYEAEALLTDGPDIWLLSNLSWEASDSYKFTNTSGIYTLDVDLSNVSDLYYFRFKVGDWEKNCGAASNGVTLEGITSYDIVLTGDFYGEKNFTLPLNTKPCAKLSLTLKFVNRKLVLTQQMYEKATTNSNGYSTLVNYYPLTISDATAYYATDNNNGSATAIAITNPAASTPMLIKGDPSTPYYFAVATSGTDYSTSNAFKAGAGETLASETDSKFNYILNGDTFKAANGQMVGTTKAYLQLSAKASASRPILTFEDDTTTGISVVPAAENASGACYNLQGMQVKQPAKGLYIRDGKKFMVK